MLHLGHHAAAESVFCFEPISWAYGSFEFRDGTWKSRQAGGGEDWDEGQKNSENGIQTLGVS
jgi:hypothetical protein